MNPRLIQNDEVERRIIRNAEEEEKVVYTRNFHGRRGWWTNSNQLGFRVPYQPPVANRPITVLRLDEAGLPRVWTLSLGVEFDLGEGNAFEALGRIDFGAGGVTQTVEVDWLAGTVISMPLNAVNVRANYVPVDTLPPERQIFLTALLARGALARSIATRTFFMTVDPQDEGGDPGLSAVNKVPPFARSVTLIPRTETDIPLLYSPKTLLTFGTNSVSPASGSGAITGDFLGPDTRFPIPIFGKYWQLSNDNLTTLNVNVVFNLFDT